jgi:bifunctional enzyme CysN/CysC
MVTGAAQADAALLLIDASEGVRDQTRRHIHLLHLLGVPQLAVVVNKMDRIGFDQEKFAAIKAEITDELSHLGSSAVAILPIAARHGDGVAKYTPALAWYNGPTVLRVLDSFAPAKPPAALPLRFPVQAVYKFDDRRIVAGRVESGQFAVGDDVTILPKGTGRASALLRHGPHHRTGNCRGPQAPDNPSVSRSINKSSSSAAT